LNVGTSITDYEDFKAMIQKESIDPSVAMIIYPKQLNIIFHWFYHVTTSFLYETILLRLEIPVDIVPSFLTDVIGRDYYSKVLELPNDKFLEYLERVLNHNAIRNITVPVLSFRKMSNEDAINDTLRAIIVSNLGK